MNNWFIKQADLKTRKPKILEFLKGKGIPEEKASEMIDTFGKADPTKDTSAEYINWIIKMVLTNKMKEEDIDKVREYLEVFSKLKKSNKLKELKVNSDINSYKDVVDLYKIVKDYLGKPVTRQESERNISYGFDKIYDKNGIKVYKITEPGVASYIAKDTNWCVKSYDTAKYYLSFGPLYLLETIGERYLISDGTDQFKNVEDREVEEDFFNEMLPVLSELNIILKPNYLIENNLDEKYYPGQREEIKKYADINKALYDKEYEKAKGIIGQLKDENRIKSYKSILPNKMIYDGDIEGGIKLAKEFGSLDEQMIVNAHRTQVLNDRPLTYHIKPKKSLRLAKEDLLYLDKMIDSYAGTEIKDGGFLGLFGSRYPSKEKYLKVLGDSIDNYVNTSSQDELEDFIEKHKEIITPEIMNKVVDYYIREGFKLDSLIKYKPEYFTHENLENLILKNIFNTKYYNAFERFVDIKKIISKFIKNNINNTDGIKKVLKLYSINKDIAREILKENNIYSEDFLDSLYKESLLNPKWFIVKTAEKFHIMTEDEVIEKILKIKEGKFNPKGKRFLSKKKANFPSNPLKKVGDTGLTEKEVWEYYDKMKYKIFPYLKGHNVLLKIFTDDGVIIKRKDSDGKYLQINTIEDYDRWNGGRQEFHITLNSEESDIAWIDIDPKIDKSVDKKKIKNTCKELIKKILKNIYNLTKDDKSIFSQLLNVQVFYSGGRGYHIFLKFKQKMDINKVKETLKKCFENNIIPNFDNVKMGITKPGEIRLDLTTLHNLGSIRVPYSYNLSTGKRSKLLFKKNIV